ncbi:hypothetical protein E4U43_001438 [Claviceps pusilla]|uniref:YCII-related domain-containing protein n=1 Tax=Claviceps pusilla TaxID=123648 RepID=A0A9P7N7Q2_9HYPO|nr:hypothetical protein E4U43_001438 [Claviceps pusilla]
MPKFAFLVVADSVAEQPSLEIPTEMLEEMTTFNEKMADAGVLLDADGFLPSSVDSYRLLFGDRSGPTIIPGPFDLSKEDHICGYWIVQTTDAEEALSWAKRVPFPHGQLLIRRLSDGCELGKSSPELIERQNKLRTKLLENRKAAA